MRKITLALSLVLLDASSLQAQNIYTVAGTGTSGYNGDGGPATWAEMNTPTRIAVSNSGGIYIADFQNNLVRKVSPKGIITTFAGNGGAGFGGDGLPADSTEINSVDVAVDDSGNVYIVDYNYNQVRKVNTKGIITTVAGTGGAYYCCDGSPAITADLYEPDGVAVDNFGNFYIADDMNSRIRKVDKAGIISTIAGNGTQGYSGDGGQATAAEIFAPGGVAVDDSGNIFIADGGNNRIRKVSKSGIISTIAGDSTWGYNGDGMIATSAELHDPIGVAVDHYGNIYIADDNNNRIRKINKAGIITTLAGTGTPGYNGDGILATSAELQYPTGMAVDDSGNIFIADAGNNRIREITNGSALGINELKNIEDAIVYPTPNNGSFMIKLSGISSNSVIDIYNVLGEKVFTQNVNPLQNNISLNLNLNNGIYILQAITDKSIICKKIEIIR
ncbi:MAG TPA: T9SS type A sorting domain-containing protein [Bacteroidia bacterium]|jgi:sugar lactone lactonase YvrE|nr:T9SS type A sorting domain-containing protein [Bacteroidia bacterium]